MELQIHYDNKFSTEERKKLESFERILKDHWIANSNNISSLKWEIDVMAEEPRLLALLKVNSNSKQIYKATCASILKMRSESFESEFIEAAIKF